LKKKRLDKIWTLIGILLAANLAVAWASWQSKPVPYAKLYFFDVGQGDAIYLRTSQGNDILIDGGPDETILSKLGRVMPIFDHKLELLVLTHPQADHAAGLVEVLKRYQVDQALVSEVDYDSATARTFFALLSEKKIKIIHPHLGQRIFLDDSTVFDIYYPGPSEFAKPPKEINEISVVGKISFGKSNILLTGDAPKDVEASLLSLKLPLASEILKVAHHGSKQSTSPEFAAAVAPAYSVISVGKNNYGHPSEQVLGILAQQKSNVLRTDKEHDLYFQLYPERVVLSNSD
jgi:competence protein ComEC